MLENNNLISCFGNFEDFTFAIHKSELKMYRIYYFCASLQAN